MTENTPENFSESTPIDITPSWVSLVPILMAAIKDGTDTGRQMAREELLRMARAADLYNAMPADCDVRKILLDIVPGDGDGHEVYAKSVADVEAKLGNMGAELEEWQLGIRKLAATAEALAAKRLAWLHSPASNNVDGYEWGVFRVKWVCSAPDQVLHTYSDFSDLDAAMLATKGAAA